MDTDIDVDLENCYDDAVNECEAETAGLQVESEFRELGVREENETRYGKRDDNYN